MGKKLELKSKGVSFNILDDQQYELYELAVSKTNFSGYVKGLMLRDMLGEGYRPKPKMQDNTLDKSDVQSVI